jgi:hypothetical protein
MNDLAAQQQPSMVPMIVALLFAALLVASLWKIFAKAGEPGWAAIVPIYNIVVLLKVAGKPIWFIVLFFVPLVSLVAAFLVSFGLAKNFGKGGGFGVGLALLGFIFYPILAFGDAQYQGAGGSAIRRAA